jgi:hypothetical protein
MRLGLLASTSTISVLEVRWCHNLELFPNLCFVLELWASATGLEENNYALTFPVYDHHEISMQLAKNSIN